MEHEQAARHRRRIRLASRPLVPDDRWSAEHPVARLAGEVLFLREQIKLVGDVMELIKTRAPFAIVPPGPHWKGGEAAYVLNRTNEGREQRRERTALALGRELLTADVNVKLRQIARKEGPGGLTRPEFRVPR